MSDTDGTVRVWRENDASHAGQAVCERCGSGKFQLGVNGAGSVRIECDDCENTVAFCWDDGSGNAIHELVPRSVYAENDQ